MKKTVSLILALILTCATLFSLTSCFGTQADIEGLNAKITELTEQINAANSKIATLEAEKAAQNAEITNLKADIEVLEAENATLASNKATLEAEKASLEDEISKLEEEIARLQALMDGNSNQLLEEIAELEAQIDSLEAEVVTLNSAKANLESEISTLNAQISNLNAEKATLTARITELEASVAAKNTEIANLNSTVSALTAEKNTLIAEKNALAAENSELKEENEELKALVEALRNCLKDIHTYVDGFCTTCGKEGESALAYTRDGDYVYFGEYPQTIKADDVTITDTTDDRGYYLGSDGNYYAKITADPMDSNVNFSTGANVTAGTVYYFKVEPIRWRILSEENGEAFLLCDSIIAGVPYQSDFAYDSSTSKYYTTANGAPEGTYANNYKYSEVRAWLNATFYETAFTSLQQTIILITEVDNSLTSTGFTSNPCVCENTNDKLFLLSYAETTNSAYGFASSSASDTAKIMLTSDYSRAMGVRIGTSSSSYGSCAWWTRTPTNGVNMVRPVDSAGGLTMFSRVSNKNGVVPALRITL